MSSSTEIQIGVSAAFTNVYLILYNGSTPSSAGYITSDSTSGSGPLWITRNMSPGTYSIEVTSYSQGVTGAYELTSSVELTQVR